ncbi:replication-relaxation family protein [Streptomyces sp. NPDC006334]|uniref:replication-relaxation family protein n=1 Tax=Streptomyces sp. NPDC006334 TaxID=3156754 RepID=UPI0033B403DE
MLGVLKVATVDQIQRIAAPHLTFRHTDKETPSERKTARTASHLGALSDLRKHGLVESGGRTRGGEILRNLTPMGLKAAAKELRRPAWEMGSTARGGGRSGGSHPMAVNEALFALLRPKPDLSLLDGEPAEAVEAAQAVVDAPDGLGVLASYATEVALPGTGTWTNPGKGGVQADIVLTAPEDGVPLLFIEIDNCYESAHELAGKIDRYIRFCRRTETDPDGTQRPMWRTRWWVRDDPGGHVPPPPLLLVFNRIGPRNPNTVIPHLAELTRQHWDGEAHDGKLPIVVTDMNMLREQGPAGTIFQRFGRSENQTLLAAIGNLRWEASDARQSTEYRARQPEYETQLRRAAAHQAESEQQEHDQGVVPK